MDASGPPLHLLDQIHADPTSGSQLVHPGSGKRMGPWGAGPAGVPARRYERFTPFVPHGYAPRPSDATPDHPDDPRFSMSVTLCRSSARMTYIGLHSSTPGHIHGRPTPGATPNQPTAHRHPSGFPVAMIAPDGRRGDGAARRGAGFGMPQANHTPLQTPTIRSRPSHLYRGLTAAVKGP